jgi:hypothetical protein
MNFNKHSNLKGLHAFLGASNYHWLNYDDERLLTVWNNAQAAKRGTELHDWAAQCIKLNRRQPRTKETLCMYVNDAIGYKMTPEQLLYYSDNCFVTCDAISFRKNQLRIHDLKTGVTPAHMEQLLIYSALFCLEYGIKPSDINTELRIYQSDDIIGYIPEADEIVHIMDKIVYFDKMINEFKTKE